MPENITDIKKWNDVYPFLEEVLNTYNDFDKTVVDEGGKYFNLCRFILKKENGELNMYNDFCMKLMRNLGYFSVKPKFITPSHERCNILYNWIYNSINNQKITVDIINKCFDEYNRYMDEISNTVRCSIKSYDEIYKEPLNITLLHIFENNMHIIKDKLKDQNEKYKIPCQKFVCKCLKIYNHMNERYCHNEEGTSKDYTNTCFKLKMFKESYKLYLYNINDLRDIIPSLDNKDNDLLAKCRKYENKLQLDSDAGETRIRYSANSLATATEGHNNLLEKDATITSGNVDSPMKKTITTTIGTFAGASSLLAFLYKFTPAGRLVNPRLRRIGGRTNNNFYSDGESELLYDEFAHGDINTYSIGYEAA